MRGRSLLSFLDGVLPIRAGWCFAIAALLTPHLISAACAGHIDGGSDIGVNRGNGGSDTPGTATLVRGAGRDQCAAVVDPGPPVFRRLTQQQYLNTVRELLGTATDLTGVVVDQGDPAGSGLDQADISSVEVEGAQLGAEKLAKAAVANIDMFAPCAATAERKACASDFIRRFGARVYRTALTPPEVEQHLALYESGAAGRGYAGGIEVVIRGMLQSPRFLFRFELGTTERVGPLAAKLSASELATRLSYALWDSMPDAALFEAAHTGALDSPAGLAAQARRMADDPRGRAGLVGFVKRWFELTEVASLDKDRRRYPQWTEALKKALDEQAEAFVDHVLYRADGRLSTLLTASTVLVNKQVADTYYGLTAGADFAPVEAAPARSVGLFTLPAFLAVQAKPDQSYPIYRGKFVREQLLCTPLPPPPEGEVIEPPKLRRGLTTRERFEEHRLDLGCAGCHKLMDPLGFTFENYDGIGRYRTEEEGKPIDPSGELTGTDVDGPLTGLPDLARKLAASKQVQACVVQKWFRNIIGRMERPVDRCSIEQIADGFSAAGNDLRSLVLAVIQSDAFQYLQLVQEVSP